jgi:hypothetical protein
MTELTHRGLITGAATLTLPGFVRPGFVQPAMARTLDIAAARREGKVVMAGLVV